MTRFQRGFLALLAIALILVGGFVAIMIAHIMNIDASSSDQHSKTAQAFYLAEAGLHRAIYALTTSVTNEGLTCSAINGSSDFTNVNLGVGQFTVTTTIMKPSVAATLSVNVNNTTTIIPVSSLNQYASSGRVLIDKEAIDYGSTSNELLACNGNPPCLVDVIRGAGNTTATSHAAGTAIGQNQCHIVSQGAVPNFSDYEAKREVSVDYLQDGLGWAVGESSGGELIMNWDGLVWSRSGPFASVQNQNLNGIYMISSVDGWAVGQDKTIAHWNGSSWSGVSAPNIPDENLHAITCVNANDCWAVGDKTTFAHWNGASWLNGNVDTSGSDAVPESDIYAVTCVAANDCWAVGAKENDALFVHWNGSKWYRVTPENSVDEVDMHGISCVSSDDCWAVGQSKTIAHWNGSQWVGASTSGLPDKNLEDVTCLSSNDCWAVGEKENGRSVILHYDGSSWSRNTAGSIPDRSLFNISCANANDCWASGKNNTIIHWNGSAWATVSTAGLPNKEIYAIDAFGPKNTDVDNLVGYWEEGFH